MCFPELEPGTEITFEQFNGFRYGARCTAYPAGFIYYFVEFPDPSAVSFLPDVSEYFFSTKEAAQQKFYDLAHPQLSLW